MAKATVKKRWFKILAPKVYGEKVVGETTAIEPKAVVGKTMKVNASTLAYDMRKQSTELNLLIEGVEGDKAKTSIIGFKVLPTSIKRIVRKGRTRLDITLKVLTKGEKVVTFKLLVITQHTIKGSVALALRREIKRFIIKKASILPYQALAESVINDALKRELKSRLRKIYPVKICDIRHFRLERFMKSVELRKVKEQLARDKKLTRKPVEEGEEEKEAPKEKPAEEKKEEKAEAPKEEPKPEEKEKPEEEKKD
jgi:small subunit ribosomal protein S3Ae